jgi:hypothetical protein
MFRNFRVGTDLLSDVVTSSWLSLKTPLGELHKSISYTYFKCFLHLDLDKLFLDFYHQVGFEAEPRKFLNIDLKLSQGGIRLRVVR